MKLICFQRKLAITLNKLWIDQNIPPSREDFVAYCIENKKIRPYHGLHLWVDTEKSKAKARREINDILGDMIEGNLGYIGYFDPGRTKLRLTDKGRDFCSTIGFLNEFVKRFGALKTILIAVFSGGFIAVIGEVIAWIIRLKNNL